MGPPNEPVRSGKFANATTTQPSPTPIFVLRLYSFSKLHSPFRMLYLSNPSKWSIGIWTTASGGANRVDLKTIVPTVYCDVCGLCGEATARYRALENICFGRRRCNCLLDGNGNRIDSLLGAPKTSHGIIAGNAPTKNTAAISDGCSLAAGKAKITADAKNRTASHGQYDRSARRRGRRGLRRFEIMGLTMRWSDARVRRHQSKPICPNHRFPPWPIGADCPR